MSTLIGISPVLRLLYSEQRRTTIVRALILFQTISLTICADILQGVADASLRLTTAQQDQFTQWINYNAERYWLSEGGPLVSLGLTQD